MDCTCGTHGIVGTRGILLLLPGIGVIELFFIRMLSLFTLHDYSFI
jgi:hypothetical protein